MTKIAAAVLNGDVVAPDILVGGTPCQAFSVAGARHGLADDRGFMTIKYVELANAIDQKRAAAGAVPCITVWENVPGVLSSKDNAFGAFLGLLAGEDCELIPPGKKWENAGCVLGPQRAIAWRVLDAQYFGVAQRRRRVFVVASAREGFDPAKVLFECEGVRRDSAPSREAGKAVAALTANGVGTCGADDNQGQAGHLIPTIAGTLQANGKAAGSATQQDAESGLLVVNGTQDPDTNVELAHTLGRNHGQENAVLARYNSIKDHDQRVIFSANNWDELVQERPAVPVAFSSKDDGGDATENMPPTLRACGHTNSHANAGAPPAIATAMAVRRLTPVECERLQGFPDNHTMIPAAKRNKLIADELAYLRRHFPLIPEEEAHRMAADGPRYKAIGNSMNIESMEFIGRRIELHLSETGKSGSDEVVA
jgi:DNA (cytosine-5)-methyltransferase 1